MREGLKAAAFWLATAAVVPMLISYRLRAAVVGPDRALEGSSQMLAVLPGLSGQYLRRAFLCRTLASCSRSVTVEFGVLFSAIGARLDDQVYVGPRCHLGLVHLERDVLLGAAVHVPSGARVHPTDAPSGSIRQQPLERTMVRVGAGSWIGSAAVVMADVGRESVVGAGSVVTRSIPDRVVAAGAPARVLRPR